MFVSHKDNTKCNINPNLKPNTNSLFLSHWQFPSSQSYSEPDKAQHDLFCNSCSQDHCLNHNNSSNTKRTNAMKLRQYALNTTKKTFHCASIILIHVSIFNVTFNHYICTSLHLYTALHLLYCKLVHLSFVKSTDLDLTPLMLSVLLTSVGDPSASSKSSSVNLS